MSNSNPEETQEEPSQILRSIYFKPVEKNFHYYCLFTRRYVKEKKRTQFYLYSVDEENFFSVAFPCGPDLFYSVSLSSNDFSQESKWIAGSLKGTKATMQFTGITYHPNTDEQYRNTLRVTVDNNNISNIENQENVKNNINKNLIVKIPPNGAKKFLFKDENSANVAKDESIQLTQVSIPNTQNYPETQFRFGLIYENELAFTFSQMHEDEFFIQVGCPLSLFQAFGICLAAIPVYSI